MKIIQRKYWKKQCTEAIGIEASKNKFVIL